MSKPKKTFEQVADENDHFLYARSSIKLLITTEGHYLPWIPGKTKTVTWQNLGATEGLFANYVISCQGGKMTLIKNKRTFQQFVDDCTSVGLDFGFTGGKTNYKGRSAIGRTIGVPGYTSLDLIPSDETMMILKLVGVYDIHK